MVKTKKVQFLDYTFCYKEKQGSGPTLFFIHGNSSSKDSFDQQFESPLFGPYHLVSVDLLGHGESLKDERFYSLDAFIASLVGFIEELKLDRPFLVGHSLGGHLAMRVAQRVETRGLFISQTAPIYSLEDIEKAFDLTGVFAFLLKGDLTEEEKLTLAYGLAKKPAVQDLVAKWLNQTDPKFRDFLSASLATTSFREMEILESAKAPFRFLNSSSDPLLRADYAQKFLKDQLIVVESDSHYFHIEQAPLFNEKLMEFIKSCDP